MQWLADPLAFVTLKLALMLLGGLLLGFARGYTWGYDHGWRDGYARGKRDVQDSEYAQSQS